VSSTTAPNSREPGVVYTKPWTVELILDLAGYTPDKRLAEMVILEPSAGDGAFLVSIVRRLVASCRRHRIQILRAVDSIQAFEIDPVAARRSVEVVKRTLMELKVAAPTADRLADCWVKTGDFLEAALGFPVADFVVGNPPYVRLEDVLPEKTKLYRNAFDTMRGRADIYVAFYQAALMQLKPGGVCAYICADRWLLNDYGAALREYITTNRFNVRYVIEAHDVDAFEAEVSSYPAITVIARDVQGPVVVAKALPGIESSDRQDLVRSIEEARTTAEIQAVRVETWFQGSAPWPCSSPARLALLQHLEASHDPLESTATGTRIGIGVATGADDVFVTDSPPDVEADRLLPLAMAFDLENGGVHWSGHYLVNPWQPDGLVNLEQYPRLRSYYAAHKAVLAARHTAKKANGSKWHRTIDRVNFDLLPRPKLYVADIKDRLLPALDEGRTYPHHNLYWIVSDTWDLRVLGGLLMSAVGEFFIRCYGVRMRGGYFRFQAQYLRRIRVPSPDRIAPDVTEQLRHAFREQNTEMATAAALRAYDIPVVPE
jgi:adenine-specific DNA-methyltransferase